MKKFKVIILLLSLLTPFVGTYFWYGFQQHQIKRAIKHQLIEGIELSELVTVKVAIKDTLTSLTWEHSKEFEFEDEMYDVVSSEIDGDSIAYFCWWDYEETDLNKKLSQLLSIAWGNNDNAKNKDAQLINFCKSLYFQNPESWNIPFPNILQSAFSYFTESEIQKYYSPTSPPPKYTY